MYMSLYWQSLHMNKGILYISTCNYVLVRTHLGTSTCIRARRGGAEVAGWTLDRKIRVRFPAYPHRVWALWWQGGKRRLRTSRCPCRGRLGTLDPYLPMAWVPGSRSKFGNWTSVPSLYSWNIAECDVKPQSTTTYIRIFSLICTAGAARQAGDADSSRAPDLTSGLQRFMNVHRGALLLVPQWQCISSFVFYIQIQTLKACILKEFRNIL